MFFHPIYLIVIFLIVSITYLIKRREKTNKIQTDYLLIVLIALLANCVAYSYSLYTSLSVNFYFFYTIRIIHYIFIFKYITTFQKKKISKITFLYIPIIFFSGVYLFGLNENFIFSQGHLNYLDYNLFHSITKTLAGPRDLFIAASLINLYYVIIVTYLVKTVLKELRRSKKKNKTHIQWVILLNLYVISSALAAATNSILLLLELDYPVLFLLNIMVITFASVIPMLFPKYAKHITSFKKEVDRSKNAKEEKEYLQIVASLKNSKMFLNPTKNISHLATITKMSPKLITHLIHDFESLSVHDYLIKLRIKYAKEKIASGYLFKYSIEALFLESGFKSPQTFYRNFKKFEGITPKEYLNSLGNI